MRVLLIAYRIAQCKLVFTVHEGAKLTAMDSTGTSDPYFVARLCKSKKKKKSEILKKTLNPVWNQEFTLYPKHMTDDGLYIDDSLEISVFDWDRFGTDDFIGKTVIPLAGTFFFALGVQQSVLGSMEGRSLQSVSQHLTLFVF